jgi:cell division protein ZapA
VAKVSLTVGGVRYDLACEAGAEERLRSLAGVVDRRATQLASEGASRDRRLLLLTALRIADELTRSLDRAAAAEGEAAQLRADLAMLEATATEAIEAAARRIDAIARSLD